MEGCETAIIPKIDQKEEKTLQRETIVGNIGHQTYWSKCIKKIYIKKKQLVVVQAGTAYK